MPPDRDRRITSVRPTWQSRLLRWFFPVAGFFSLIWFLLRVIPKPSRAAYPCQRVAFPLASGFVLWLLGIGSSMVALRSARQGFMGSRYMWAALWGGIAVAIAGLCGVFGPDDLGFKGYRLSVVRSETTPDPVNTPIGVAKGRNPGRVVWVHDPDATDWEGSDSHEPCWDPAHTNLAVVNSMVSRALRRLSGESTDAAAWETLFRYFNREYGSGDRSYVDGEKVAVKVNLTTCNATFGEDSDSRVKTYALYKAGDTSPQMILALLQQLVDIVGVEESNITVGDPTSFFPQQWYDMIASEFPNVHYLDHYGFTGRTQVQHSSEPFDWSTSEADEKLQDYLPVSLAEAHYIINFAVLKGHTCGITVCAKNHYGSMVRNPMGYEWGVRKNYYDMHESLPNWNYTPGRGYYRALVDLMGHRNLGGKTVLYLIDGLFAGIFSYGDTYKWNMSPFNGDWPSSLFASQDPVAIDSVAYDFLYAEWPDIVESGDGDPDSLQGGAQDYLHEAALADYPPSGTFYDPEKDGVKMESLGVHEHWNNSVDKQYSRNLGLGDGIELISLGPNTTLCKGDSDLDGDVDGSDLAEFSDSTFNEDDLLAFAAEFGRTECSEN